MILVDYDQYFCISDGKPRNFVSRYQRNIGYYLLIDMVGFYKFEIDKFAFHHNEITIKNYYYWHKYSPDNIGIIDFNGKIIFGAK